ncbi:sugar phosphate isomerase/epimerase family protein [Mucilaginibacter boryungensis]|uniref:Sugar phosphate isomerase/epimerase n=1 Tax=Mucilaginibacter boryungensis TaxID=768480 RepID=A0ABR9XCZ7_9SPHI|nr:sugar phosphate isomerase/epimerase family protein [Mucilaginibacter boryungensis]MBE9665273.1 sugar phosphate isomerase/epimerase [Mucilaginibacter boryungensis]
MKNKVILGLIAVLALPIIVSAQANSQRYKVAVADIMIIKRQKLGAFQLTKTIGADGVEVDMGGMGPRPTFENTLAVDSVRKQFLDKSKELNIEISSLAMTGFFAQPFGTRETAVKAVGDCITTMKQMGVKVAFLPLGASDPATKPEQREAVIARLKEVGKMAEKEDVVIGIGTALPAKDQVALLKEIGSPAVKSYFNFQDALDNNRDLEKELKTLGKKNIVMIHCTDTDGEWLQNDPKIDMKKVKATLDKMGWSGWLVLERSRDVKDVHNVKKNFGANTAYVKSIFQQ